MKLNYLKWFLLLCFLTTYSFAEPSISQGMAKANVCGACHGIDGISSNLDWPNLAGQHISYLIKQLQDYKTNKTRQDPTMTAFVAGLSDEDIEEISAFYASLSRATCKSKPDSLTRGEEIYKRGDLQKHITACIACHGPDGTGNAQAVFPLLSGQNVKYTIMQLNAFKDSKRHNDINGIMHDISKHMSDEDMQAVADYICSLN